MGGGGKIEQQSNIPVSGLEKYEKLLDSNLTLQDFAPNGENMKLYEDANQTLLSIVEKPQINENEYKKLYKIIVDVNASIFGHNEGTISSQQDQGGTMTSEETAKIVEGGNDYYTDTETTITESDTESTFLSSLGLASDKIKKFNETDSINLENGMILNYYLNKNVYRNELESDDYFFQSGTVVGKYEITDKNGNKIKENTITIFESAFSDEKYLELDGTGTFNDIDTKIKLGNDNNKPNVIGALKKLIKNYEKEEPDELKLKKESNQDNSTTIDLDDEEIL